MAKLLELNLRTQLDAGLLICCGGFEDRAVTFAKNIANSTSHIERILIIAYESQKRDNEPNLKLLERYCKKINSKSPDKIYIDANTPVQSCRDVAAKVNEIASEIANRSTLIDISGLTNLASINVIHACILNGLQPTIIYTEALKYYPPREEASKIVDSWQNRKYEDVAKYLQSSNIKAIQNRKHEDVAKYLQSSGLKAIQIHPEFGGNFRAGYPTCIIIFVGYEPNRVEGLVDTYAPSALVVLYGKSPHKKLYWRTALSRNLHKELFSRWRVRESEISTLVIEDILAKLENEFYVLQNFFDVALAPQCSKMQAVASYLFWRKHPEVQLLFTSPVRFNPKRYSVGAGKTFIYEIPLG